MARNKHQHEQVEDHNEAEAPDTVEGYTGFQIIKIAGRPCSIRAPYTAEVLREMDHAQLTIMANALNALRGENVRNNVAATMKTLAEKEERQMTDEEIAAYDASYDIGTRRTRSGALQYDPIGKEERRLAQQVVDAKLKEHAKKRDLSYKELRAAIDKDTYQGYISSAVATGKFRAVAERNVSERASEASIELDFSEAA